MRLVAALMKTILDRDTRYRFQIEDLSEISAASILQRKLRPWTFLSGDSFQSLPDFLHQLFIRRALVPLQGKDPPAPRGQAIATRRS